MTQIDLAPVKTFVLDELLGEDMDLAPDEEIFSSGLLDSLSVVQLMQFLEERFTITISPGDVTLDDFDTLERIGALVAKLKDA